MSSQIPSTSNFPASRALRRAAVGVALALLSLGAVRADDVHLANGSVFEGVIATTVGDSVVVETALGRIVFAASQVREIVRADSPLADYRGRRAALRDRGADAAAWLELGRFAAVHDLDAQSREALLAAARLDPSLEGLRRPMFDLGYELDPELGWLPRAEAMRRRGLVRYGDAWVEPEHAARLRRQSAAARQAEVERRDTALAARLEARSGEGSETTANDVALASVELARAVVERQRPRSDLGVVLGYSSGLVPAHPIVIPALPLSGGREVVLGAGERSVSAERGWDALARRQPGSLIPLRSTLQELGESSSPP